MATPDPSSFLPLPQAQFHVLVSLTHGERHGYAIMQDVESSSGGVVRMGPATLYGTLKRLVDQGLAEELAERPPTTTSAAATTASPASAGASARPRPTGWPRWSAPPAPTSGPGLA